MPFKSRCRKQRAAFNRSDNRSGYAVVFSSDLYSETLTFFRSAVTVCRRDFPGAFLYLFTVRVDLRSVSFDRDTAFFSWIYSHCLHTVSSEESRQNPCFVLGKHSRHRRIGIGFHIALLRKNFNLRSIKQCLHRFSAHLHCNCISVYCSRRI